MFSAAGLAAGFIPLQTVRVVGTWAYRRSGRIAGDEEAMGFGDIKLIGAIGAFLGVAGAVFSIMAAALFGTLVAIPLMIGGRKALLDRLPFGPYLSLGAVVWFFWGAKIAAFYFERILPPL
jgi:Type II secretory pathway, prepilin signal peptidase PulO and related peptidases